MFARRVAVLLLTTALAVSIALGAARPSTGSGRERGYVVHAGDTLWSIAVAHYAGDPRRAIWEIEQRNGLDGSSLRVGEVLVLPP